MYHARPMLRFVLIAGAIFATLNVITISQLIRIHPRRRSIVIALAVICNLMWLFLPWLNAQTDFSRAVRATLGPPWFAWLCFVLVYPVPALLAFLLKSAWPSRIFLWATLIAIPIGVYTALVPLDVERVPIVIPSCRSAHGVVHTTVAVATDLRDDCRALARCCAPRGRSRRR